MSAKLNKGYLNNPDLPNANDVFEFTAEQGREIKRCAKKITHFAETYFTITTLDHGKQKITLYRPQRRIIKSLGKHNRVVCLASRQTGKTTIMTIYALWLTCFNSDKTVLIVANKEKTAINILKRVRMAYEQLPNWLKPGIKKWGDKEVILANDSRISISSTSSSASRGDTANCVVGGSIVTLKSKESGEVFDISMEELTDILSNDGEILDMSLIDDELGIVDEFIEF